MEFFTDHARAGHVPGVTGVIRQQVSDFKVFEQLPFELEGAGEHEYLRVRKTGNNTGWVAGQLAAHAGIRDMDVGFAGRKDRWAVCEQWFSCYLPGTGQQNWSTFQVEGVDILLTARHRSKLKKGQLASNRFELKVRDLNGNLAELEPALNRVRAEGFPNYFGPQRFGREEGNLHAADTLMRGGRVSRNRDMILSVARSYLFNRYLSDLIHRGDWAEIEAGFEGPLYGRARDPQAGEAQLNDDEKVWVAGLRRLKMSVGARALRVRPEGLVWSIEGDSLTLVFTLPAGAFATSLLREVLDIREYDHGEWVQNADAQGAPPEQHEVER